MPIPLGIWVVDEKIRDGHCWGQCFEFFFNALTLLYMTIPPSLAYLQRFSSRISETRKQGNWLTQVALEHSH